MLEIAASPFYGVIADLDPSKSVQTKHWPYPGTRADHRRQRQTANKGNACDDGERNRTCRPNGQV